MNAESQLHEYLDSLNYTIGARPVVNSSFPITVWMALRLIKLVELSSQQRLTLVATLMTAWVDTVMTWNPSNFGGITTIYRRSETIWRSSPFTLWNSITSSTYYALNGSHPIILKYDGTVAMDISGTYAVVCEMDVTFFPWDSHTCQIQIKPSVLDVSGMVIRPANNLVLAAVSSGNSGWSVDTSKVFHYVVNTTVSTALGFPLSANTTIGRVMSVYYLNFTLIRRSKYYMFSIIAPVCINTALSLVALIIPGGNGKRIGLTMTSFLSFSVLQSYVNTLVPRGNTIPLLSQYILSQLTLSAICVISGVLALLLNNVDQEMPSWLRSASFGLARALCVLSPEQTETENENDTDKTEQEESAQSTPTRRERSKMTDWDVLNAAINRLFAIVCATLIISLTCYYLIYIELGSESA